MFVILSHLFGSPLCLLLLWSCLSVLVPFLSSQRARQRINQFQDGTHCKSVVHQDLDVSELSLAVFDIFLVLLFIFQHKVMATSWFKSVLAYFNIVVIERLLYVAATSVCLLVMMAFWKPIESWPLWYIDTSESFALWLFFILIHAVAWFVLFLEGVLMDPLEMIGIKQIYYYYKGFEAPIVYMSNRLKRLYSHMRHPGALSLFVILWFHPHMSLDRFILAILLNIFMHCGFPVTMLDYKYAKTEFTVKKVTHQLEKAE